MKPELKTLRAIKTARIILAIPAVFILLYLLATKRYLVFIASLLVYTFIDLVILRFIYISLSNSLIREQKTINQLKQAFANGYKLYINNEEANEQDYNPEYLAQYDVAIFIVRSEFVCTLSNMKGHL